jgi:RNA polymerase sigma-70 factor, ECF subfamily
VDFETLANEHKDAVYRQMLRVCGNHEDAEDVLIEALLKAYGSLDQLRDHAAFRSWLAQIGRRVCWQLKGREKLLPIMQLSAFEDGGQQISAADPPLESQLAAKRMREALHAAIDRLPPEYRSVYELRDVQEVSGEEAAEQLGLSLAAMKSRLHRARAILREELDSAIRAGTR